MCGTAGRWSFFVADRQRAPLMTDTTRTPQAQLTELDYKGHVLEQPPAERVTASVETAEDLYAADEGDLLWIDGTEYAVVKRNFGIFHSPLSVVGEDGTQGRLIGGTINQQSSIAGIAWTHDLPGDDDDRAPQPSDLLARFDRVYRLEEDRLDCLHAWTPDSDHRVCPACEERSGEPIRIEQQAGKAVELRQCTNTDCQHIYRYVRPFPEPDTAALLISTGTVDSPVLGSGYTTSETVDEYELSGVFRCTEQDDFKFPVETNRGRDDGFYSASEVAAFCNPKLDHDDPDDRFGTVTVDTNDRTGGTVVSWRDAPGSQAKMTVEFQELVDGTSSPMPDYDRALDWNHNRDAFTAIVDQTSPTQKRVSI